MGPKKLECLSLVSLSNLVQDNNIPYLALLNFTKNVKSCEYGPLGLGRFVEQKLALSPTLSVTKFLVVTDLILVTLCLLMSNLICSANPPMHHTILYARNKFPNILS
jgi:hypothetical protein